MRIVIALVLAATLCGTAIVLVLSCDSNDGLPGSHAAAEQNRGLGMAHDGQLTDGDTATSTDPAAASRAAKGSDRDRTVRESSRGRRESADRRAREGADRNGAGDRRVSRAQDAGDASTVSTTGSNRGSRSDKSRNGKSRDTNDRDSDDDVRPDSDGDGIPDGVEVIEIQGTVVVLDTSEIRHEETAGSFLAVSRVGTQVYRTTVEFESGAWQTRVPQGSRLEVRDVLADDRSARVSFRRRPVRSGESIEIVANWARPYFLRVLGDDGEDLHQVDVVARSVNSHFAHPGDYEDTDVLTTGESSPVDLARLGDQRVVWVTSPGYAWLRVQVPRSDQRADAAEKVVTLVRSADAVVDLQNFTPNSKSILRVRSAGRTTGLPQTEFALDSYLTTSLGSIDLMGLRPGNYVVSVEVGEWRRTPEVLGSGTLTVDAENPSFLSLILEDAPIALEPVTLSGSILLPSAAEDTTIILNVEPLELFSAGTERRRSIPRQDMEESEDGGTLLWDVGEVLPGRYTVEIEPFQYREIITVTEDDSDPVEIQVPELADVTLCAIDDDTNEPVVLTSLSWQAKPPAGVTRQSFRSARLDEESGCYTLLAPEGEITVSFSGPGVRRQYKTIEVDAGANEITLEVSVDPGVRIQLVEGETLVSISQHSSVDAQEIEGDGRKVWWNLKAGVLELYVTGPGLYALTFADLPGYEPIPATVVEFLAGEVIDLEVEVAGTP